jgi:hypothetical protein
MTQTATLLLLFAGELTSSENAAVAEFARKNHVNVVAPAPTRHRTYPTYSRELVLDLEGRLDEARTLAASLDEDHAELVLAGVERELLAHAELPQAAWLLAERHRLLADVRRATPEGVASAAELLQAARAIEGPRAAAFGIDATEERAGTAAHVHFRGLHSRDVLELDGIAGGAERAAEPGLHQLRVLRGGELVFAGWATLGASPEVELGVPFVACSSDDLGPLAAGEERPTGANDVACERYFVARHVAGRLELADCRRSSCSAFMPLVVAPKSHGVPVWATVALATAGVVASAVLVTWAAGGFEHDAAPEKTVFVYGGLK